MIYSDICKKYECRYFIVWDFGGGKCESCENIGQSYIVHTIPEDCPYIDEMEELKNKKCESCSFIDTAPTDEPCANCRYLHIEE